MIEKFRVTRILKNYCTNVFFKSKFSFSIVIIFLKNQFQNIRKALLYNLALIVSY